MDGMGQGVSTSPGEPQPPRIVSASCQGCVSFDMSAGRGVSVLSAVEVPAHLCWLRTRIECTVPARARCSDGRPSPTIASSTVDKESYMASQQARRSRVDVWAGSAHETACLLAMIQDGLLVAVEAVELLRAIGARGARKVASSIKDEVNRGLDASFKLEGGRLRWRWCLTEEGRCAGIANRRTKLQARLPPQTTMSSYFVGQS